MGNAGQLERRLLKLYEAQAHSDKRAGPVGLSSQWIGRLRLQGSAPDWLNLSSQWIVSVLAPKQTSKPGVLNPSQQQQQQRGEVVNTPQAILCPKRELSSMALQRL